MGIIKDNKKFDRNTKQDQPLNPEVRNSDNKKFDLEKKSIKEKDKE